MKDMAAFVDHFRTQRRATERLVAAIPEAHFDWRPSPASFSCGEMVRHMMQAEVFWRRVLLASAKGEVYDPFHLSGTSTDRLAALRQPNLDSSRSDKLGRTFAECLERWAELRQKTEAELLALPPEAFHAPVAHPLAVMEGPVWAGCLFMVNHEVHHRGQLSAYLKTIGVDQPASLFD